MQQKHAAIGNLFWLFGSSMPHSGQYADHIVETLRWALGNQQISSLPDAWMQWRNAVPSDIFHALNETQRIFDHATEYEQEYIVQRLPYKVIDSILPRTMALPNAQHTKEERKAYRRYVYDIAHITSALSLPVREEMMHVVIPVQVMRAMRDTVLKSADALTGVRTAIEHGLPPRPVHLRHTTAIRARGVAYHIDWSIVIDPQTGKHVVHWHALRPGQHIPILQHTRIPLPQEGAITIVHEPQSVFDSESYITLPVSILRSYARSSAVPLTVYSNGSVTTEYLAHAEALATVRVVGDILEISPAGYAVLTLIS